jgi:hypothetical protein|tara:strand:+ start:693 stop:1274 length:582 start_codon:yes stop_codon:yes gene_type:complete
MTQTRPYTTEYHRINASVFKSLLTKLPGNYTLNAKHLSNDHCNFELKENESGDRSVIFTIDNKPHNINLSIDNRSVSTKLYLCCPYCRNNRQSLYAIKTAYACRECIGLHYATQSERPQERLMRRIRKLRTELWGYDYPEVNNLFAQATYWPKPKGIRWKTFYMKRNKIGELEDQYWPIVDSNIQKLNNSIGR